MEPARPQHRGGNLRMRRQQHGRDFDGRVTNGMPAPPAGRPPRRDVVVTAVTRLSPRFVRVVVAGELDDWPEPGAAAHMKIFLPQPGSERVMRTYTVRGFDRVRGEVTIDVYLHEGNGPAARWAATVRPGAELQLGGRTRSTFAPSEEAASYLFAGDSSALPAIATCLETLPAGVRAVVVARADELPLESKAPVEVAWVGDDDAFLAALHDVDADRSWVACEAGLMRRARGDLLARFGRERVATRGYWKLGEADHPDHDTGDDGEG
jgi:NADPH-dependent ferric siderophore reductase